MWLAGMSWRAMAREEGVHVSTIRDWSLRHGRAQNRPRGRLNDAVAAAMQRAMRAFRACRLRCEELGIDSDQLDALEPWGPDVAPDPWAPLTAEQREALLCLADAHDDVIRAWRGGRTGADSE